VEVSLALSIAVMAAAIPASIVADNTRQMRLGWKRTLNDLPSIVSHAYDWERNLR
jgi:UDP-glucose 4-epimerase